MYVCVRVPFEFSVVLWSYPFVARWLDGCCWCRTYKTKTHTYMGTAYVHTPMHASQVRKYMHACDMLCADALLC